MIGRSFPPWCRRAGTVPPEALFAEKFVPGVKHTWQVKRYDGEGQMVSEGPFQGFVAQ